MEWSGRDLKCATREVIFQSNMNGSEASSSLYSLQCKCSPQLRPCLVAQGNKKKKSSTGFSRPLRSQVVDAVKDECDFEADLVDFMDESDNDVFQDAKPFSFSTINTTFGSSSLKELGKTTTKV